MIPIIAKLSFFTLFITGAIHVVIISSFYCDRKWYPRYKYIIDRVIVGLTAVFFLTGVYWLIRFIFT